MFLFDRVTQLLEGGIDGPLWNKHFPKDACAESLKVSARSKPVSIRTIAGLFLILLSGVTLALTVLLGEYFIDKTKWIK